MNGVNTKVDWVRLKNMTEKIESDGGFSEEKLKHITYLCARNGAKNMKNAEALKEHSSKSGNPIVVSKAIYSGPRILHGLASNLARNMEPSLALSVGCPVTVNSNLLTIAGLVNGAEGIVYEIIFEEGQGPPSNPIAILVKFSPDVYFGPSCLKDEEIPVEGVVQFNIKKITVPVVIDKKSRKGKSVSLTINQFPLNLAFAKSIHKCQGLTLESGVVDIGDREFSIGLLYVCLSRFRDMKSFYFKPLPPFSRISYFAVDPKIRARMSHELHLENQFYETIVGDCVLEAEFRKNLNSTQWENYVADLMSSRRVVFVPHRWKLNSTGARSGGGVFSAVLLIGIAIRKWKSRLEYRSLLKDREENVRQDGIHHNIYFKDNAHTVAYAKKYAQKLLEQIRSVFREKQQTRLDASQVVHDFESKHWKNKKKTKKQKEITKELKLSTTHPTSIEEFFTPTVVDSPEICRACGPSTKYHPELSSACCYVCSERNNLSTAQTELIPVSTRSAAEKDLLRISEVFGLPFYPGKVLSTGVVYPNCSIPDPDLSSLSMRARILDFLPDSSQSVDWEILTCWMSDALEFNVKRDHSLTQIGDSCGIVGVMNCVWLKNGRSNEGDGDFWNDTVCGSTDAEIINKANSTLADYNVVPTEWGTSVDTIVASTALRTKWLEDDELKVLERVWDEGFTSRTTNGDDSFIKWRSLSQFLQLLAEDVHNALHFGEYTTQYVLLNHSGHWVTIIYDIQENMDDDDGSDRCSSDITSESSMDE